MENLTNKEIEFLKKGLPIQLDGEIEKHINLMSYKIMKDSPSIRTDKFMFGCALKYILFAQKGIKGQGDIDEGILARLDKRKPHYSQKINSYIKTFGAENLYIRESDRFSDIWRKQILSIPFGCFFHMTKDIRPLLPPSGSGSKEITVDADIPFQLFADFYNAEIEEVKIGEFCIVNYLSDRYLYECIAQALSLHGVSKNSISIKNISYSREPNKEWECPELYDRRSRMLAPELFYKDSSFSHQNEKRIAVFDKSFVFNFINPFDKKTINLSSLL